MQSTQRLWRSIASRYKDFFALLLPLGLAATVVCVRAFNSDGHTDILWHNDASKQSAVWFLKETNYFDAQLVNDRIPDGWRLAASADFNRDGHVDFFMRSASTGSNTVWFMKGTARIGTQPLVTSSAEFDVGGAGDFDGDGYPDVLWRDAIRNQTVVWLMDGTNWNGRFDWITPQPEFRYVLIGVADFNNDSSADILWRDRYSGMLNVWYMNGTRRLRSVDLKVQPDAGYRLVAAAPFNLIGNTDLLWQHTNGQSTIWLMSGTQHVRTASLPPDPSRTWRMIATAGFTNRVRLSATTHQPTNQLTLLWRDGPTPRAAIERREFGETDWRLLATNYVPTRFTNSNLAAGRRYEFRVGGDYMLAGLAAAPVEDRGRIILAVERSLAAGIQDDLELLKRDLVGDGWSVIQTNVPRHDDVTWSNNLAAIASLKGFITNVYYDDPIRTKAVFLIGHVPIPYSGFQNPDGHGARSLPADIYYGDVDGIYTDERVHYTSFLPPQYLKRHDNLIGDGKFDQNRMPANSQGVAELELAVARADLSNLPSFGGFTEEALTHRYIQKAHRYRHKKTVLPERVTVATYFPIGPNRDVYAQATTLAARFFGNDPAGVIEGDALDRNNPSIWGLLGAYGLPFAVYGNHSWYHQTSEMASTNREPKLAFLNVFASFCVDFHYPDNFLRAFLATPTYGLGAMWFRPIAGDRVPVAFEPLGLGEPVGAGFVRSINQSQRETHANAYVAYLGDPTLRLQVLAPPAELRNVSAEQAAIEWDRSPETNALYFVYRSSNHLDGPWQRVTDVPLTGTNFVDLAAPPGPKLYQVRAAKLTATGSGSFTNLSQGVFIEVD